MITMQSLKKTLRAVDNENSNCRLTETTNGGPDNWQNVYHILIPAVKTESTFSAYQGTGDYHAAYKGTHCPSRSDGWYSFDVVLHSSDEPGKDVFRAEASIMGGRSVLTAGINIWYTFC